MAQVTHQVATESWIEHSLTSVAAMWESLPAMAEEWDSWNEHDRLIFAVDWPVIEDRWQRLRSAAASGDLSPRQLAAFEKLSALITRNRPILEQLLAE